MLESNLLHTITLTPFPFLDAMEDVLSFKIPEPRNVVNLAETCTSCFAEQGEDLVDRPDIEFPFFPFAIRILCTEEASLR